MQFLAVGEGMRRCRFVPGRLRGPRRGTRAEVGATGTRRKARPRPKVVCTWIFVYPRVQPEDLFAQQRPLDANQLPRHWKLKDC